MQLIMRQSLKCLIVPFALVLGSATTNRLAAQMFTDPVADDFIYNNVKVKSPTVTSNYSRDLQNGTTLYLSTWNTHSVGGASEFIYFISNTGTPALPIAQGSFTYKDVSDLEVGLYYDYSVNNYIVPVAYYENGVGHRLDLYELVGSTLVLTNSMQLSFAGNYGRIRMDSHNGYGIVIAWENPGIGIELMACNTGTWSGVTQLQGTNSEVGPDVAFNHISSGPNTLRVCLAYRNPSNDIITTSFVEYSDIMATPQGGINMIAPQVDDQYNFPGNISNLSLDCPDHYYTEDWAYTFTDGEQVVVRFANKASMSPAQTRIVNDGSFGNVPTFNGQNTAHTPTLHYGDSEYGAGGYTGQIKVGWYNVDDVPNGSFIGNGRYIGVEMQEDGGALMSDPDYMGISQNPTPVIADFRSGISFSKMGEGHWGSAPPFLYTTYFIETDPGSGDYELHHAFHRWDNVRFRGSEPPVADARPHIECGPHIAQLQAQVGLNVFPNPFKNTLTNNVTMTAAGLLELSLTDISGRQVGKKQVQLNKGRHMVKMNNLGHLLPGTYFLSSFVDGKITGTKTVVKQ